MITSNDIINLRKMVRGMMIPSVEITLPRTFQELKALEKELLRLFVKVQGYSEEDYIIEGGYPIPKLRHEGKGIQG